MTFSATIHHTGEADLQLDVRGRVLGAAAGDLQVLIAEAIEARWPNTLMINLHYVTTLSVTGVCALLAGYVTAIDHGTSYRVLHARGQARYVLQATGTMDVLADSDDLGALLLAALALPRAGAPA